MMVISSDDIEPVENRKPLSRDEILNTEESSKIRVLPSGKTLRVNYLAFFLV
jgi:hypothetical protein